MDVVIGVSSQSRSACFQALCEAVGVCLSVSASLQLCSLVASLRPSTAPTSVAGETRSSLCTITWARWWPWSRTSTGRQLHHPTERRNTIKPTNAQVRKLNLFSDWLTACWSRPATPAGSEETTTTWTGERRCSPPALVVAGCSCAGRIDGLQQYYQLHAVEV